MPSQPQHSWRHHYVPKFYLNRWRNPYKHWVLRWKGERLLPLDRYSPRQTGHAPNLYQVGPDDNMLFDGEARVMGMLDDQAAPVFCKLVDRREPADHEAWSVMLRFLWALAARNPTTQQALLSSMPTLLDSVAEECSHLGIDHRTLREIFLDADVGPPALQLAIIGQIDAAANPLASLPCEILVFPGPLLVTSLYPLVSLPQIDDPKAVHLIALGPDMALVFSADERMRDMFRRATPDACATTINQIIALSSDTIIGATEDSVISARDHLDGWARNPEAAELASEAFNRLIPS